MLFSFTTLLTGFTEPQDTKKFKKEILSQNKSSLHIN